MPECDYCGASHDTEEAHLEHLGSEHRGELGPIDRRRLEARESESGGLPTGPIAIGAVLLISAGIVAYVVFVAGASGGNGDGGDIGAAGSAHYHGTMEMTVLGDEVDFSRDEYQLRDQRFHFEAGDGTEWHAHATGVTFEYAMTSLGFEVSASPAEITFEGTTYADGEGYEVVFEIDGEPVTDVGHVLEEGDHVRIVVRES